MKGTVRVLLSVSLIGLLQCHKFDTNNACGGCRILTPLIQTGQPYEARRLSQVSPENFLGLRSHSGFLTVKEKYDSNLFFWFFPAKTSLETTPWIIWLQGGPGYSSMFGLFNLVGPLKIENREVKYRNTTLAQSYSVLFLDNPVGAGYSFTKHEDGYTNNEDDVGEQMLVFLQQFLQMFPELQNAPLFLAGESYAGKYIPALGIQIHRYNIQKLKASETKYPVFQNVQINLRGLIIGGGMINPGMMMHYSKLVNTLGFLDENEAYVLRYIEQDAVRFLQERKMIDAANKFNETIEYIKKHTQVSVYNYMEDPSPNNKAPEFQFFINRPDIRNLVGAGNVTFDLNNQKVYEKMLPDIMNSTQPFLEELLEHYAVMCYHGQQDIIMAYSLAMNTYNSLQWSGRDEYLKATRSIIRDEWNHTIGYAKSGGGFTEMLIRHAGHMVPGDQPDVATYIHYRFIADNIA